MAFRKVWWIVMTHDETPCLQGLFSVPSLTGTTTQQQRDVFACALDCVTVLHCHKADVFVWYQ